MTGDEMPEKCKCPCHTAGNIVSHTIACACKVCELCGERYTLADIAVHMLLCPLLCLTCTHPWECHKMGSRKPMCLWPNEDFEPFITQLLGCDCEKLKGNDEQN